MAGTFVGREQELGVLAGVWALAATGRRQLAVVTGEAGIGKSWFCERASELAREDGFDVVWGRCWAHGGAPALWPWPAMLPALVGAAGAELLAADSGRDGVDPERFARFTAVAELLAEVRGETPTMIVIDDVQSADTSALLLTRFLASILDRLPLVVVLARRVDAAADEALLAELQRDATTIPLRPFTLEDIVTLLTAHGQPDPGRDGAETLLRVTGGSPLYLTRAIERGWTGSGPATLEQAIGDAIGRLSPAHQRVLAFGGLLGVDGTIAEVANLAGVDPSEVLEAHGAATDAGLIEDGFRCHDLVRQVAIGRLDPAELLDAHGRAAVLLADAGKVERAAQHALAAAVRSDADAQNAIIACRAAASALRRGYAYEPAAELLDRAVALGPVRAELLVERAVAVLACGRLTDARPAFEAAAAAAERAGNPVLLARAVLGLGGVWLQEHRNAAVRRDVLARQRAALGALPDDEQVLRCRLRVRLAAEAVYEGEPIEAVLDALAEARALGDPRALAEALSLSHNAMLGPEHAARRLSLAEEQIAAASAAGDGILALFGLLWRTSDLYWLGDPAADRSLTELRQRSTALGVATVNYIVACMDVMRLIRAGLLVEAEAAAGPCLRLGIDVGDADATGYYGAQLLAIRFFQGRDAELADLVGGVLESASLATVEYGFRVSVAMVLARGGRLAEARAALEPLRDNGLAKWPTSSTWLSAMVGLVETAWELKDRELAAEVAELLRPFADVPVMPSLAVSCFGSASRALGRAALTVGDAAAAVPYLEQAVTANLRLEHRPAVALSRAELAEALVARGGPGDVERARLALADALAEGRSMGMTGRVEAWAARAAALERPRGPAVLRRGAGGAWTVTAGATRIDLPDLVGLDYLSQLLEHPGCELAAVDLCGAAVITGRQPLLDAGAVAAYRTRIRELDAAIADADLGLAQRLRLEREAVADQLTQAVGLGGRMREFSSSPERARTAVRKAIKRALDMIHTADPVLGAELRGAISTGTACGYTPTGRTWRVERA